MRDCRFRYQLSDATLVHGAHFLLSGRAARQKAFCINEDCPEFVPEDKRGYKKKAAADKKTTKKKTTKKTKE